MLANLKWQLVEMCRMRPITPPRPSEISEKKLEHIGKVIFDIPFMMRRHAESMKKNPGSPLGSTS